MKHSKTIHMPARFALAEGQTHHTVANEARLKGARENWNHHNVTITRKPAAREVYWIGAAPGAREPEFTGYHPGVILRPPVSMSPEAGTVVFVPLTTDQPREIQMRYPVPPYCRQLSENPGPDKKLTVWAICDKVMTASICRLEQYVDFEKGGIPLVPKLSQADFEAILEGVASAIVPLRTFIEKRVGVRHDATLAEIVREHERRVELLEYEILERLTAPNSEEGQLTPLLVPGKT